MEERVVEVGFRADRVEGASVPGANLVDEVGAEVGAFLVLFGVVEVDLSLSYQHRSIGNSCLEGYLLTCTRIPRYAHTSGNCCSSAPSFSLPPASLFCICVPVTLSGSISSNTFRAPILGFGKAVLTPCSMASANLSLLRSVEVERSARRVKRESNASTAWRMRLKLLMMTAACVKTANWMREATSTYFSPGAGPAPALRSLLPARRSRRRRASCLPCYGGGNEVVVLKG